MFYSVDRMEDDYAVLIGDDERCLSLLLSTLPSGVTVGTMLRQEDGVFYIDLEEEQRRREEIAALQNNLRRR